MSVGLFKFDGNIYDDKTKLILSKNIASESKYYEYLDVAITELNIMKFKDGAEIRKNDLSTVLCEIDSLIQWVKYNVIGYDLEYFLDRLNDIREILPTYLQDEDDVIYIF